MDIIVVRHGVAMDRDEAAANAVADEDRPLTPKGRRRMKEAAKGVARLASGAELLLSSPLLRATQTAKLVRRAFDDDIGYRETPALIPHAEPAELARALTEEPSLPSVLVVGHEPHLGRFIGWCLAGQSKALVELDKGGACLLRFSDVPSAGEGQLVWLLSQRLLRRVG
ncbi:MAG TPA: histidine phosphatase family protein [Polyangiaceae bacterium]|jgi:phosphohistidine phosphatase|nr:histidine phosphatase family protein [Polyangiaceae bacterium]